jgi:hypothetical protein
MILFKEHFAKFTVNLTKLEPVIVKRYGPSFSHVVQIEHIAVKDLRYTGYQKYMQMAIMKELNHLPEGSWNLECGNYFTSVQFVDEIDAVQFYLQVK